MLYLPILLSAQPLSYTVSWLGIPVVDVTITLTESDSSCHAEYHAQTRPWFNNLYFVDNRHSIWVDPVEGYPLRYEKLIHEHGQVDSLWASYNQNPQKVVYANGLMRPWQEGAHSLFSALLWVQRYDWTAGEEQILQVEVEGVVWEVSAACSGVIGTRDEGGAVMEMRARFERQLYGEPILSTTDILTHMLPGEGHQLRFSLDIERNEVMWIEFGSIPFLVRAELNSLPEHH
ncbi:MAG: DUF3108 domain-containing protein [Fidelibacterota bacterium]|nr:MAG: DUF3108 domain-containing protein [Candidatus Neomarinimicrobiota bacterium]